MHSTEDSAATSPDYRSAVQRAGADLTKVDLLSPELINFSLGDKDEFLLLREMHHRLANTLMILTSALRREFAPLTSPDFQDSLVRYEARLLAFGDLHRALVVGAADGMISARYYIERLCKALSEALLKPLGVSCEVFADAGEFQSERCERLGLVVAELVTNAAKHAFRGRESGNVKVELIDRGHCWVCIVSDNGAGPATAPPGMGSKILEQLVRSLNGTLIRKSEYHGTSVFVTCRL